MSTKEQLESITAKLIKSVSKSFDYSEPNFTYAILDSLVTASIIAGIKTEYIEDAIARLFIKLVEIKAMSEEDKKEMFGRIH